jgi:hypothetical protein
MSKITKNQEDFLSHIWHMIDYWNEHGKTKSAALEGLAFSILVAIDGGAAPEISADELTVGWLHEVFHGFNPDRNEG